VQNFTISSLSLPNHNMYTVSIRNEEAFGVTKERINIEKKR
jgi:hypothetical protein